MRRIRFDFLSRLWFAFWQCSVFHRFLYKSPFWVTRFKFVHPLYLIAKISLHFYFCWTWVHLQVNSSRWSRVFTNLLSNSPKRSPRSSPGSEGTENMFPFFYKIIIFRLSKEKDNIRSAYVYFNFFHETVNFHNLKTANHITHVIFMLHSAMKTHL